jgi:hypothetical protein
MIPDLDNSTHYPSMFPLTVDGAEIGRTRLGNDSLPHMPQGYHEEILHFFLRHAWIRRTVRHAKFQPIGAVELPK